MSAVELAVVGGVALIAALAWYFFAPREATHASVEGGRQVVDITVLSPMIAAAAMALSSISVVLNAARLNGFEAPALPAEATSQSIRADDGGAAVPGARGDGRR